MNIKLRFIIILCATAVLITPAFADDDEEDDRQSVTGHVYVMSPPFGNIDKYSFAAIRRSNGRVSGQFEFEQTRGDDVRLRVHGTVDCVMVIGNRARIGGTIRHTSSEQFFPVGAKFIWSVTDNGEGSNDERDTASELLEFPGDVFSFCSAGGFPLESPLQHGNVQVRP